jgi:hypothetical protein
VAGAVFLLCETRDAAAFASKHRHSQSSFTSTLPKELFTYASSDLSPHFRASHAARG